MHEGVWRWEDVLDLLLLLLLLWRLWRLWWWLLEMVSGHSGRLALARSTCWGRDHGVFITQAHRLSNFILHRLAPICRRRKGEHH